MSTNTKFYSLDKAAPGMFENAKGGWVKRGDYERVAENAADLLDALQSAQAQINHLISYAGGTDGFDEFSPLIDKAVQP